MIRRPLSVLTPLCVSLAALDCGGTLDAGRDVPHGLLPIDERNPVVMLNDSSSDNWSGEYAALLSSDGGPKLAAIVICSSNYWPDLNANVAGWKTFVEAARGSGLSNIPDVTASASMALAQPGDGQIDSTTPNHSDGAQRIIELSRELGTRSRPLVVVVGTKLTDVADAYLVDRTVVDRVLVVAALGGLKLPGAVMTGPNGDLDPWADWIVAHRFHYVQVSAFYDQTADVTMTQLGDLPDNALGHWMAGKQPGILALQNAADQVAVLAAGLSGFATNVVRVSPDAKAVFGSPVGQGPPLVPDPAGNAYVVTQIATPLAASNLWRLLLHR